MTIVIYKIIKSDLNIDYISYINISGHSKFSYSGKDIVCSGISSIVFGMLSFFTNYRNSYFINYNFLINDNSDISFFLLNGKSINYQAEACLRLVIHSLINLSVHYPNNLFIKQI